MEIAHGTLVDARYVVLGRLGRGAMAVVYLVRHDPLGTTHALKVLLVPTFAVQRRLVDEGRAQGRVHHRHVVRVVDVVDVEGAPGLVMEFVRGPSLDRLLHGAPLALRDARALGTGILLGVRAAHREGMVHRDLKPANVLVEVTESGLVPKIADFGLAKLLAPDAEGGGSTTRTGSSLGTPAYMAPEQIRDPRSVDGRADVFSLGAILYELLTGARAFPGDDLFDLYARIGAGRYVPARALRPEVPPELEETVAMALEIDRDRRLPTVDALLERWTGGLGEAALQVAWDPALVARARAMVPGVSDTRAPADTSTATFELPGASIASPAATTVPGAQRGRWVPLLGAGALAFAFLLTGGTLVVGLLVGGWLTWGPNAPDAVERIEAARGVFGATSTPLPTDLAERDAVARAWEALLDGEPEATLALAERAREGRPDVGELLLVGTAELWADRPQALDRLGRAERLAGQRPGPLPSLARLAGRALAGDLERGQLAAHRRAHPDDLLALLLLAQIDASGPGERLELLEAARAMAPEASGPAVLLAEALADRGRFADADALLAEALARDPEHPRLLAAVARVRLATGDVGAAREAAQRAALGRDDALLVERLAAALRADGDLATLDGLAERLAADPDAMIGYARGRAAVAFGLGRAEEAVHWLQVGFDQAVAAGRADRAVELAELDLSVGLLLGRREDLALAQARAAEVLRLPGLPPVALERLQARATVLAGLIALEDGDAAGVERAIRLLEAQDRADRLAGMLRGASLARSGAPVPDEVDRASRETCTGRLLHARSSGLREAYAAVLAADSPCGASGPDRYARADAHARLAGLVLADGDRATARVHLEQVDALVSDPDLGTPLYQQVGRVREDLTWAEAQ